MFHGYLQVLSPILGLMINVLVQISSFRFITKMGLLRSVFLGFTIGILGIIVGEFYFFYSNPTSVRDFISILVTNLITYSALGYCYFHFINLGETARRIRILREIYDSGKAGLTMEEILQRYNDREILKKRVNRLLNNRQIILKDEKYFINSPIMLLIAKAIVMLKLVLLGKKSEFD